MSLRRRFISPASLFSVRASRLALLGLAVGLAVAAFTGPAQANGILLTGCGDATSAFGTDCSLDELLTNSGSIQIGDKLFDNFRNLNWTRPINLGSPTSPAPETLVAPFTATSGELGLEFSGPFSVSRPLFGVSQPSMTMVFDYDVSVIPSFGMLISDNTLELVNPAFTCSNLLGGAPNCTSQTGVLIDETVTVPGAGGAELAFKRVLADATGASMLSDHRIFTTALPMISVNTDIALTTQSSGADELMVQFDSFRQTFSQIPATVPEPASLALFAAGLAGLGFLRRREAKD